MKHDQLLYILSFKKHPLIKIGVTCNLHDRICQHQENFNDEFDLFESYVITGSKRYIGTLERQILNDTVKDIPESIPFDKCPGISEVRKSYNLNSLIEILQLKSKTLDAPMKIYKGIDLSGFRSNIIPEKVYPHHERAYIILDPIGDVVKAIAKERNQDNATTVNELLYEHLIGISRLNEFKHSSKRSDFFVVPNGSFPSKSTIKINQS